MPDDKNQLPILEFYFLGLVLKANQKIRCYFSSASVDVYKRQRVRCAEAERGFLAGVKEKEEEMVGEELVELVGGSKGGGEKNDTEEG